MKKIISIIIILSMTLPNINTVLANNNIKTYEVDDIASGAAASIESNSSVNDNAGMFSETYKIAKIPEPYLLKGKLKLHSILTSDPDLRYRNILTEDEKIIYDAILENAKPENVEYVSFDHTGGHFDGHVLNIDVDTSSDIFNYTTYDSSENDYNEHLTNARVAFYDDYPELGWASYPLCFYTVHVSGTKITSINIKLITDSYDEIINNNSTIDAWANQVIEQANACPTIYDKLKLIHDLICDKAVYDYDVAGTVCPDIFDPDYHSSHSTAGIPIMGKAVCDGYAEIFKYICDKLNIPCITQSGEEIYSGSGHKWNLVKLDDGKWYYLDVTWDDNLYDESGIRSYKFFLNGSTAFDLNHSDIFFINNFDLPISEDNYNNSLYTEPDSEIVTDNHYGFLYEAIDGYATITGYDGTIDKTMDFEIPQTVYGFNNNLFAIYNVTGIAAGAFKGTDFGENTNVILPYGLKHIGDEAFSGITAKSINIPKTVTKIASQIDKAGYVFSYSNIGSIDVDIDNFAYSSKDGVLFSKDKSTLYYYPSAKQSNSYTVPYNTKELADMSFAGASNLKDLYLGDFITSFKDTTFSKDVLTIHSSSSNTELQQRIKDIQAKATSENTDNYGILTFVATDSGGGDEKPDDGILKGDINGDGYINITDAIFIARLGIGEIENNTFYSKSDINGDGNVDITDAVLVAKYSIGEINNI